MIFSGQRELFFYVWNNRPHISEISGAYLGHEAVAHFFAHIIGKGAYPSFKLREDNIVLLTREEHYAFDQGDVTKLPDYEKHRAKWEELLEKKQLLIQEYNRTDHKKSRFLAGL